MKEDSITIQLFLEADVPDGIYWGSKKQSGYVGIRQHSHSCCTKAILQSLFSVSKFKDVVFALNKNNASNDVEILVSLIMTLSLNYCLSCPDVLNQ